MEFIPKKTTKGCFGCSRYLCTSIMLNRYIVPQLCEAIATCLIFRCFNSSATKSISPHIRYVAYYWERARHRHGSNKFLQLTYPCSNPIVCFLSSCTSEPTLVRSNQPQLVVPCQSIHLPSHSITSSKDPPKEEQDGTIRAFTVVIVSICNADWGVS